MAKVTAKISSKINALLDSGMIAGVNTALNYVRDILITELNKDESTAKLTKYVSITPAKRDGKKITGSILVDRKYAYRLDKGFGPKDYYGRPLMHFHISRWPQYSGAPAHPDRNGWFHFRRISHFIKPRNFVEKTMRRAVLVPDFIKKEIKIVLK